MNVYFYLILGIAAAFGTAFTISTKGIYYNSPDTDNELMTYAAAQSHKWRLPSDVHTYGIGKTSMKECTIILLSVFQKIFRDKTSCWPYTAMAGLAVSISTILIYSIASNYFNQTSGLIVAMLYIISFWPWQISLYGGHVNMANLFFLLSVYSIQIASGTTLPPLLFIAAGGVFLGFSLFSSPSSQKYFIAVFSALFFAEYRWLFTSQDISAVLHILPANKLLPMDAGILAILVISYILALFIYRLIVNKMYRQEMPEFLNKIMSGREHFSLEYYLEHARRKIRKLSRWIFWTVFSVLLLVNLIPISPLLTFIAGLVCAILLFTLPDIKKNVTAYFAYMLEPMRKTQFRACIEYFAKRGITVKRNTRGAGLSWVPKLLWTFMPFHAILFVTVFATGQYKSLSTGNITESISLIAIAIIALSPIIWAEITKAPQVSRLYSPGLITSLLLSAYVFYNITWTTYTLIFFSSFVILTFTWNLWKFTDDVYPARMAVRNLMQAIRKLGITDIYAYRTVLNGQFIDAIPGIGKSEYLPDRGITPPFHIHYIRRLDEVSSGWIVIPGSNRMAMTLKGLINDDYTEDPVRLRLMETKQMDKIAVVKLKTFGTSAIWTNEDEVSSYCAQFLKHLIGSDGLYGGYAWLIHSSKISH